VELRQFVQQSDKPEQGLGIARQVAPFLRCFARRDSSRRFDLKPLNESIIDSGKIDRCLLPDLLDWTDFRCLIVNRSPIGWMAGRPKELARNGPGFQGDFRDGKG